MHTLSSQQIHLIQSWALSAGQMALQHQNALDVHIKSDDSPVTQADLEIAQFLQPLFAEHFPDTQIVTEETAAPDTLDSQGRIWLIDPIDGTYDYIHKGTDWGISIGLMQAGKPIFGLFHSPVLSRTVITSQHGLAVNGQEHRPAKEPEFLGQLILSYGAMQYLIGHEHSFRTWMSGSLAHNLVRLALGEADAFYVPPGGAAMWDLAAGAAMLEALGLSIVTKSGEPLDYSRYLTSKNLPALYAGRPKALEMLLREI